LSSYGGNGGTRSFFPPSSTADGIFFTTGAASEPKANQTPVGPEKITGGLSHTLLFGERSHYDPNYQSFNDAGFATDDQLGQLGWWGASADRRMIGHVTMSGFVPVNYQQPFSYENRAGQTPPADTYADFQANYVDERVCAFGSCHPGGACFCLADASVPFLTSTTQLAVLQALCVRTKGGNVE
jgi:hypothetical protein